MIEILNKDMSPIVDYISVGDIFSVTDVPLVLHNTGTKRVAVMGAYQEVVGSDGYERLRFRRAIPGELAILPTTIHLHTTEITGGSLAAGDVLDIRVGLDSWATGRVAQALLAAGCTVIDSVSAAGNLAELVTNIPVAEMNNPTIYLRRTSDSQWFIGTPTVTSSGLSFSELAAIADPGLSAPAITQPGYEAELTYGPLPSWAPVIAAGEYAPAMLVVLATGGSSSQNLQSLNPRKATITITGGELA